jgi:hypothetical protein
MTAMLLLLLVIALGSAVDCWYTAKVRLLPAEEYNPLARLILKRFGFEGLVASKCFTTAAITGALALTYPEYPEAVLAITAALAAMMMSLSVYLWLSS